MLYQAIIPDVYNILCGIIICTQVHEIKINDRNNVVFNKDNFMKYIYTF